MLVKSIPNKLNTLGGKTELRYFHHFIIKVYKRFVKLTKKKKIA